MPDVPTDSRNIRRWIPVVSGLGPATEAMLQALATVAGFRYRLPPGVYPGWGDLAWEQESPESGPDVTELTALQATAGLPATIPDATDYLRAAVSAAQTGETGNVGILYTSDGVAGSGVVDPIEIEYTSPSGENTKFFVASPLYPLNQLPDAWRSAVLEAAATQLNIDEADLTAKLERENLAPGGLAMTPAGLAAASEFLARLGQQVELTTDLETRRMMAELLGVGPDDLDAALGETHQPLEPVHRPSQTDQVRHHATPDDEPATYSERGNVPAEGPGRDPRRRSDDARRPTAAGDAVPGTGPGRPNRP